jgi:energy-coupling factor transport system permease protein
MGSLNANLQGSGAGPLRGYDPRAKLLLLAPLLICYFLPVRPIVLAPYTAALGCLVCAGLGPKQLLAPLRFIGPMLVFIFLLTPPFYRGGRALLSIFDTAVVSTEGLRTTLTLSLRLTGLTLGFFLVIRTTTADELVLSLRWFGLPYPACLVIVIAIRTVPSLSLAWRNALDAHKLRSASSGKGRRPGIVERYLPVLTSVFIHAVKGIPVLAMALENRGFGRSNRRTEYFKLKGGPALLRDFAVCMAIAAVFLLPALIPT